jgi:hypothetical protein
MTFVVRIFGKEFSVAAITDWERRRHHGTKHQQDPTCLRAHQMLSMNVGNLWWRKEHRKSLLPLKILNILTPAQKKMTIKKFTYISTIFKLQDSILVSTDTRDSWWKVGQVLSPMERRKWRTLCEEVRWSEMALVWRTKKKKIGALVTRKGARFRGYSLLIPSQIRKNYKK